MWLKLKIFLGYAILVLLSAFIVYQFRQEQMLRHTLRKEEKELVAIHRLTENSYIGLLDLSTHAETAVTWDDDDLREYSRKCHRVCDNLQFLKEYVHTPLLKKHIDSLCLLLWNKYNPQIQISAESETKRSIFREKDKTKRSKKESAQHSKSRNKSFVMTSVSAL